MPLMRFKGEPSPAPLRENEAVMIINRALGELALDAGIANMPIDDPRRVAWYAMFYALEDYARSIPCVLCGYQQTPDDDPTRCFSCGCVRRVAR